MLSYADVQNALTLRRCLMSEIIAAEATVAYPELKGKWATADRRHQLQRRLIRAVAAEMSEPFRLTVIDKGSGEWKIEYEPLMTEAEAASMPRGTYDTD